MKGLLTWLDEKIDACEQRAEQVDEDLKFVYLDAAQESRQARTAVAALIARNAELEAERVKSDKYAWTDGYPPYPHAEEWFLANTEFGHAVLRSLPEEYAYDYKTADETYIIKEKVKRWMQLPDSEFVAYESRGQIFELRAEHDALAAENRALREDLQLIRDGYCDQAEKVKCAVRERARAALARTPAKGNDACDCAT